MTKRDLLKENIRKVLDATHYSHTIYHKSFKQVLSYTLKEWFYKHKIQIIQEMKLEDDKEIHDTYYVQVHIKENLCTYACHQT